MGIVMDVEIKVMVRKKGIEPSCLAALDPKSSASTNFATSAHRTQIACIRSRKQRSNILAV